MSTDAYGPVLLKSHVSPSARTATNNYAPCARHEDRAARIDRHGGGWQVMAQDAKIVDFEYGDDPNPLHQKNFIDCIRSRKDPNGSVEQGHLSACLVHLANLSLRVGKKQLHFDAQQELFTNSDKANSMLKRPGRKHYRIPEQV